MVDERPVLVFGGGVKVEGTSWNEKHAKGEGSAEKEALTGYEQALEYLRSQRGQSDAGKLLGLGQEKVTKEVETLFRILALTLGLEVKSKHGWSGITSALKERKFVRRMLQLDPGSIPSLEKTKRAHDLSTLKFSSSSNLSDLPLFSHVTSWLTAVLQYGHMLRDRTQDRTVKNGKENDNLVVEDDNYDDDDFETDY